MRERVELAGGEELSPSMLLQGLSGYSPTRLWIGGRRSRVSGTVLPQPCQTSSVG